MTTESIEPSLPASEDHLTEYERSRSLHPERYYVKRENPFYLRFAGLARQIKDSASVDQTLGAYLVQFLLSSEFSSQVAGQIAAAWTGDQLSAYAQGENFFTAWLSAWKNDDDARRFYRTYQTVLGQASPPAFRSIVRAERYLTGGADR